MHFRQLIGELAAALSQAKQLVAKFKFVTKKNFNLTEFEAEISEKF